MSTDERAEDSCLECGEPWVNDRFGNCQECGAVPCGSGYDDRCTHSPSAWRSCVRCTDAYGDMMNER